MTPVVRHFDRSEWADFVRNQGSPEQRQAMISHLQTGCSKCRNTKDLLERFAVICKSETSYRVPADVERSVKAFFALNRQVKVSLFERILGNSLYDSCNDLLPAGLRTGHQISRHVLFQAGDYSVDLRFEHERGSASMVMVGQIANRRTPEELMAHIPVILFSGNRELTRSLSNSFGEFQLEYTPQANLNLRVPLEARGQELEVVLNDRGAD
ncbi:MAG TPA: hypothetical protein VHA33_00445 [Candidatus Angelobacter sp.]|jgi:hypothetical protein|nr:hypothetical protein [Candidatus Angelobacter sp.]